MPCISAINVVNLRTLAYRNQSLNENRFVTLFFSRCYGTLAPSGYLPATNHRFLHHCALHEVALGYILVCRKIELYFVFSFSYRHQVRPTTPSCKLSFFQRRLPHIRVVFLTFERDPRFNDETIKFLQLLAKNSESNGKGLELEKIRQNSVELHRKGNASLQGTFKGTLEEQVVKTPATGM